MTRDTSIEIYRRIKEEGLLSKLRFDVYEVIFQHGPLTQMEAWQYFDKKHIQLRSVTPRFSELLERDVIGITRERPCKITGNLAIEWDVTNRLPVPVIKHKRPSYKELLLRNLQLEKQLLENICNECKQVRVLF